jgi:hypothetical protein
MRQNVLCLTRSKAFLQSGYQVDHVALGGLRSRFLTLFGGPARPRAHRRHGLCLRAGFRRGKSEGGGLFPAPKTLVAAPEIEGWQSQRNGLPP